MPKGLLLILSILLFNMAYTQDIVINEMMSFNGNTIMDDFGDFSDWVELYNSSAEAINVDQWCLSDDENELDKWQFPDTTIFPNSFLLIFCSGRDTLTEYLHAGIKLKSSGEQLILSDDDENIIDQHDPVVLGNNISYGNKLDGGLEKVYFYVSSPGSSNINNAELNDLSFSHDAGFYESDIDLSIFSQSDAGQVYYTVNGNEPHPESSGTLVYEGPISIIDIQALPVNYSYIPTTPESGTYYLWEMPGGSVEKHIVIRARVFNDTQALCDIHTNTYFLGTDITDRFSLPVLSVIVDSISLFCYDTGIYVPGKRHIEGEIKSGNYFERGDAWERKTTIEYFSAEGDLLYEQDLGLRLHGNITRAAPQKPLQFIPRNKYDGTDEINYPFFEDRPFLEYKRIISRSIYSAHLGSIIRDEIAQDMAKDLNVFYQQWQPVITFLNGEYWGVQNLREKLDENYLAQHFDIDKDSVDIIELWGVVEAGDLIEYSVLINFIENNDLSLPENYEIIETMIDIPAYIDYYITEIFADNRDWPGNNYAMWRKKGENQKWRWFLYDLDGALKYSDHNNLLNAVGDTIDYINPLWSTQLFKAIVQNNEFAEQFLSRFVYLLNNDFSPEQTIPFVDKWESIFEEEVEQTILRWGILNNTDEWREVIDDIREFLTLRPCSLKYHLEEFFDVENLEIPCDSNIPRYPSQQLITVYPNPAVNSLNIFSKKKIVSYEIFNLSGTLVKKKENVNCLYEQIDIANLASGFYTLRVYAGNNWYNQKIIINR